MRELVVFLVAVSVALLWVSVLAPLVANIFGVPARASLWRIDRRNQHLTTTQYFWTIGLLGMGMGMLLLFATMDLGEGRHLSVRSITGCLLGALLVGLIAGFRR